jgi:hypothetical protein
MRLLSTLSVLFGLLVLTVAPAMAQGHGNRGRLRYYDDPPGWSHGRKAGWGNCDLPPGLAKKRGCYPTGYRLVRYPVERGSFVVVRVPVAYRGWYQVDDYHQLWVDDRGFWRDNRSGIRLSFVID